MSGESFEALQLCMRIYATEFGYNGTGETVFAVKWLCGQLDELKAKVNVIERPPAKAPRSNPTPIDSDEEAVRVIDNLLYRLKERPKEGAPICSALTRSLYGIVYDHNLDGDPREFATMPKAPRGGSDNVVVPGVVE